MGEVKNKVSILDCTLRDGGYYNNWDYDREIVDRYLSSVNASKVNIVELGFRSYADNAFAGPYLYSTDKFLNQLNLPKGPLYGVMINGKEFLDKSKNSLNHLIDGIFQRK